MHYMGINSLEDMLVHKLAMAIKSGKDIEYILMSEDVFMKLHLRKHTQYDQGMNPKIYGYNIKVSKTAKPRTIRFVESGSWDDALN